MPCYEHETSFIQPFHSELIFSDKVFIKLWCHMLLGFQFSIFRITLHKKSFDAK